MTIESSCQEFQEIIAALFLPGPFHQEGKHGWNVQELAAVCPSIREPHRASQILYDTKRQGITQHIGGGTTTRHYLRDFPHGKDLIDDTECPIPSCPDKWYPDRDILKSISRKQNEILTSLRQIPKGGTHVQAWIWEAWENSPAVPLTKKEILSAIRKNHEHCQEHVVSQQLLAMVQSGKLRQHKERRKAVAFIPVRGPDLFTLSELEHHNQSKAEQTAHSDRDHATPVAITGILPEVSVYLGEDESAPVHPLEVRAFVTLDDDGNIRSIHIKP